MTSTLPKKFEAFAVPGGLKGQLADLSVPEILQQLGALGATGILTLVAGGARKAVYVKDGKIVFASSNLPNDRLGEILLREGKITVEEYDTSIKAISRGKRQGKALIEMGALSPKDLWEGVQFQVKEIVYSIFNWDEGTFHFEESSLPEKERITVDLDIGDMLLSGLRRVDAAGRLQTRYPEGDVLLELVPGKKVSALEPYEGHVLALVDGERSVIEISRESEIGDNETLKVLYALLCTGALRVKGRKVHALDQDFVPVDSVYSVLESFNQMYEHIFKYMVREVGPIAENVLEKYVASLRDTRKDVFTGLKLLKDGTIDGAVVEKNLNRFPEEQRRGILVDALNELLYAELLAVKRTLGNEHEAALIRTLRDR
jgi:uncharacterized protein DUF4388